MNFRVSIALAIIAVIILFPSQARAQIELDTDYAQSFEDTSVWPPTNWYMKGGGTGWTQGATTPRTGSYTANASGIGVTTDFGHAMIIDLNDPGTAQVPGLSLIQSIQFWYRIASTSVNARTIRVMATDEWPRIWSADDADYIDEDPAILVDAASSQWDASQWTDLTGWIDIRDSNSYSSLTITDTTKLSIFEGTEAWIAIFARAETSTMTLRIDDFAITLNKPTTPNAPRPLTPLHTDSFHTPIIDFSWIHNDTNASAQAGFEIQISTDSLFGTIIDTYDGSGASDTSTTYSTPLTYPADSIIYWRVRTSNYAEAYSAWSAGDSFFRIRLHIPDTAIPLDPPADHETTVRAIRFQWLHNDPDSSAQDFAHLQLAMASDFSNAETMLINGTNQYYDTTFSVTTETMYWRVRTADALNVFGPWSDSRMLLFVLEDTPIVTRIVASSDTPLRSKMPSTFDTSSNGDTIWLSASTQTITIGVYALSRHFESATISTVFDSTLQTVIAPSPCTFVFTATTARIIEGDTTAYAVAWDRSGKVDTVQIRFRMDTTAPTKVSLSAPANNNLETSNPTFSWAAASDSGIGVSHYLLQVAADSFFSNVIRTETTSAVSLTLSSGLSESIFWWRVIPYDTLGNYDSYVADTRSITVDSTPPTTASLLTPADGLETSRVPVYFTWTASADTISGLANYILQASTDSTFSSAFSVYTVSPAETYVTGLDTLAGSGTYWWRVLSRDTAGNTAYSSGRSIILDTTAPSAPANANPPTERDTNIATIYFNWSSSADAHTGVASYRIQLSNSSTFGSLVVDSSTGVQSETTLTLPANDTYWWRVTAYDRVGNMDTGSSSFVRIDTLPPTKPVLAAPLTGDTRYSPVGHYWAASSDSMVGGITYRIQISSANDFSSLAVNATTALTYDTEIVDTGNWYWRVIVTDSLSNTETSTTETYLIVTPPDTTPPAAFTLTSPSSGHETTSTSVIFRWQNALDSSSPVTYQLVIKSSSGAIADSTTTTDSFVTRTLPVNDSYRWSVTAYDPLLNARLSTDTFTLTIDTTPPTAPGITSPQNLEETRSPVRIAWSASSDALTGILYYRIELCTSSAMSGAITIDSYTTSTETMAALGPETYYLRVTAYDRMLNSNASGTRAFTVKYSGESATPVTLAAYFLPDSRSNSGSETTTLYIYLSDSSTVDTVTVNLASLGSSYASYSDSCLTMNYSDTNGVSGWFTVVRIDSRVISETYYVRYRAIDRWYNIESGYVALKIRDTSTSYVSIASLPAPSSGDTSIAVSGNVLTLLVESAYDSRVTSVLFQYRPAADSVWITAETYSASGTTNPAAGSGPWMIVWDLPNSYGYYEIQAVGITSTGESDPSPSFITIRVQDTGGVIGENRSSESTSILFTLYKTTADTIWFDTAPFLLASTLAVTSRDSVQLRIGRYDTAPSDAPAPNGHADGSGLILPRGGRFYRIEALASVDSKVTLSFILDNLTSDSMANLSWYRYSSGAWTKMTSTVEDLGGGRARVTIGADSFSVWAPLIALAANNLSNVILYPNPYVPYDNNDRNGIPFVTGVDGTGIIFENLTNAVTIEAYTVAGKLVSRYTSNSTGGKVHWDARNLSGQELASGMYVVIITSTNGERVVKKLMIIR